MRRSIEILEGKLGKDTVSAFETVDGSILYRWLVDQLSGCSYGQYGYAPDKVRITLEVLPTE